MSVVTGIVAVFLAAGLCVAQYICPHDSVDSVQDVFGSPAITQRGIWHRLPCPTFRQGEALLGLVWYKGSSIDDTNRERLISHSENGNFPASNRYTFSTDLSLIIKGVKQSDEGRYLCQVIPFEDTERDEVLALRVFGDSFPASTSEASSTASFQRGRRQTLPCECASQTPDVVYWSTGEGVTTDTQIIGARFSDGVTLQIQHGADYSIGSDASLTVNSLVDVQDTQRFWCHVFQSDGTLRNCDTNVQISVDEMKSASDALKVSERSFYLRSDTQQILPCLSWTPGATACEVEWSKLDNPDRQVLSYNLSTGVDSSPEFDLASDFGLVIQSVDDGHAGVYRCAVGDENQIDVEVRVIGDRFPLAGGSATEGDSVTFKPESRLSLQCPAFSDISLTTKATLFWSFGAPDAESTTVIGTLNLPDGPIKMSDPGDNSCLDISMEGALLLNNCSQDDDVRYWCHVFPANDNLIRSYVDVLIENSNGGPGSSTLIVIAICVPLFFIVLLGIVIFLICKRRRRSSHSREDKEKGHYKQLHKQESVPELDLKALAQKIKAFVISKMGRIPITPWVDGDDACFSPIDTVYKALEIFVNVSHGGSTVKYKLDSKSGIFDDGIPELASKHAIIQGRRGCGKTTFLYRLIFDWAMGRERALLGSDQIVVVVPAWLLIKAKTIGEAVVECILPKDANISAESIDAHYARDKSNLTILVDDCNDRDDVDAVMKVMTDNKFLGCHLVLTTRSEELAKTASRKFNMRHVTIRGFTLRNAIEYINVVLDTAYERKKDTPEHKVVKSKAVKKSNIEKQKTGESQTVSTPPETNKGIVTDTISEKSEAPKTTAPTKKRNLSRYLEEHILQPDISCLPAVLAALCQLSIWTEGEVFKPDVTMANVFFKLVKFMFARMKGLEVGVTEREQISLPTKDQLNYVLAELGRVAYSKLVDSCANDAEFSKEDFLSLSEKGEHILEVAIDVGLLRPRKVDSNVESTEQITEAVSSEVSEVKILTGCLCCKRKQKQQNGTHPDPMSQDTELTPLTCPKDERVYFVLEILEQLCVAVCLTQITGKVKTWLEDIANMSHREFQQRFSNVFLFAIQDNQVDREALVDYCAKIVNRGYSQARPYHVVLQLQKFVELCLQLNFEGQCEGALNKKLKSVFPEERIRLIGISSYKLRMLSYLLEHAQPEDKSNLNVKSIELLRIAKCDWPELQEYMEYFISRTKGHGKKKLVERKTKDSHLGATGTQQAITPASQEDIEKLSTNAEVTSSKIQPQPDTENRATSEACQATDPDPQNDMEKSSINRTQQTDQSQSNTQPTSVPLQQVDNEYKSVPTFTETHLRNESNLEVRQSSVSDAKVDNEKTASPDPQTGLGNVPETQHRNNTRNSLDTENNQPSALQPNTVDEPLSGPRDGENKSDDLSLSEPQVGDSPNEEDANEGKSTNWSTYVDTASYDVIKSEKELAVLEKLRAIIQSREVDLPRFPSRMPDISVLQTLQTFGLQELLESQAGECFSSGAARDLACYLPRLKMLESLVLVGTILSSDAICDLAKRAHQLPNLKKLDLRLNRQFDDRAFVAVTNLLLRQCRKLTDLRLSLYRVTIKGFDEVQTEMKDREFSWGRLKTLYLLHGSPAEKFVVFLSNSVKYFHYVECFHLSATYKSDKIHDNIQGKFDQNMTNPKIMPHLEDLDIGNMETLKARLASLKLPKKEKGSVISNLFGTTVTDLGKKTVSGIAESVADTMGGAAGAIAGAAVCAGATAAMPMSADDNHFST